MGRNPRTFGGTNLVARLEATVQPSGLFGVQDATFDGAFRQGLSLLGPLPGQPEAGDHPGR